jgi:hypothetical protein
MSQQDDFKISVSADVSELVSALQQASSQTQQSASQMSAALAKGGDGMAQASSKVQAGSVTINAALKSVDAQAKSTFATVQTLMGGGGFAGLLGIAGFGGVGAIVKSMSSSFIEAGERLQDISNRLGISANDAKAWMAAAKQSGVDTDEFSGAMIRLERAIGRNDPAIKNLHISTTELNGSARNMGDIFKDVVTTLSNFTNDSNRAVIAQHLLGTASADLIAKGQQLVALQEQQSQKIQQTGRDWEQNVRQMEALRAINATVDGQWKSFVADSGPALIAIVGGVSDAVKVLGAEFVTASTAAQLFFSNALGSLSTLSSLLQKFQVGDFVGMFLEIKNAMSDQGVKASADKIVKAWTDAFDTIQKNYQTFQDALAGKLKGPTEGPRIQAPSAEDILGKEPKVKAPKAEDWQPLEIEVEKVQAKFDDLRATALNLSTEMAQDHNQAFQQMAAQASIAFDKMHAAELAFSAAVQDHDKETARQVKADWDIALEEFTKDSHKAQQIFDQDQKKMEESTKRLASSIGSEFSQFFTPLITGSQTFAQVWNSLVTKMLEQFIQYVTEMVVYWIAGENMKKAASEASNTGILGSLINYVTQGLAIHGAANATEQAQSTGTGAIEAGKSAAAIPYIGWLLAAGAAAGFVAMAMSYRSAAQGFDVPAGMSPLTQLHPREMVLPSNLAEGVRRMSSSQSASGGDTHNYNIGVNAVDAQSVQKLLNSNGRHIANVVAGRVRSGQFRLGV